VIAVAIRRGRKTPVGSYLRLELRRQLRNRRFVIVSVALPVALYVLYTAVLRITDTGQVNGISWPAFFLVSMAAYGAMAASITQATPIAAERANGWTRQLRVTPLPSGAYVVTKVATAICLTAPALVLLSVVAVVVNHVELPLRIWLALDLALALGALPFATLGILLGYVLDTDSAQGAVTLSFFGLAILGGLFAPVESFPSAVATIAHVLPSYHLAEIGRHIVAGGLPDIADVGVLAAYTAAFGGIAAWRYAVAEGRARGH
jgi:ABC-2 type transport system permease protein